MANTNAANQDDGAQPGSSPSAQAMRDLRKESTLNCVAKMNEKLIPYGGRGQNDKILDTTRQGRTIKDLKPQCPPNKGIIKT